MEYIIMILAMAAFVLFIGIKGMIDKKKMRQIFLLSLQKNVGSYANKKISEEQFRKISKYYKLHRDETTQIDDMTWHDCDMDDLFMQMNYSFSSAGEEYLYYLLRTPQLKREPLDEIEKLVSYFGAQDKQRFEAQVVFHTLGNTGKYSLYDYIDNLNNLKKRSNKKHIVSIILIVFFILLISFSFIPNASIVGIIGLVGILIFNIVTYYKDKNEVEPYLTSFSYILRLIEASGKLMDVLDENFLPYIDKIKKCRKELNNFSKNSFLAMSMGEASANPLDILIDYIRLTLHIDLMKFNTMLKEAILKRDSIDELVGVMGYIESMISIACYRKALPYFCIPSFTDKISIKDMYHSLIENPVVNSIDVNSCILLTGSNASGKSTFLKTMAINAIFAETIHTCMASAADMRFQLVYSSMKLEDSISSKESYYMAEIKAMKRILDATKGNTKVICFVDEVLRGTNTVERIAASTQILKSLSNENALCFAATHDVELTKLLCPLYENYHFTEEVKEKDVYFSYKIEKGPATTRNAIQLLSLMGYEKGIINNASRMATNFIEKGYWEE